jgi:hypothetical protein
MHALTSVLKTPPKEVEYMLEREEKKRNRKRKRLRQREKETERETEREYATICVYPHNFI